MAIIIPLITLFRLIVLQVDLTTPFLNPSLEILLTSQTKGSFKELTKDGHHEILIF
jgi:hypothetical protein